MPDEYADTQSLLAFVTFLSLPMTMVATALVHYIAQFRSQNDDARLQGLLAGCQAFLLRATIAGSVLAVILADPLGRFFHFRTSLMLTALICVLVGLWSGFAVALCQGMAWFKRLAVISLCGVVVRLLYGWILTLYIPKAEVAVSATAVSLLTNLALLYWWKDIFRHGAARISPWNREFLLFLFVSAAYVAGNYFFLTGDALVAKRYFVGDNNTAYQAAGTLARAIPAAVTPLLLVMFTSRSGSKAGHARADQRILLGLSAIGLTCGAFFLIVFRALWLGIIFGHSKPEVARVVIPSAAPMIAPLSLTIVLGGLSQAIGIWSLASKWLKLALLYGALGVGYWLTLLLVGKTPEKLLQTMPLTAGAAFFILCMAWLFILRRQAPNPTAG